MKSKNWHNISTVKAKTIVSKNEYYFYAHYNIIFSLDNFFQFLSCCCDQNSD